MKQTAQAKGDGNEEATRGEAVQDYGGDPEQSQVMTGE